MPERCAHLVQSMSRNPVGAFSELVWGRGEKELPPIPSNGITSSCMEFFLDRALNMPLTRWTVREFGDQIRAKLKTPIVAANVAVQEIV